MRRPIPISSSSDEEILSKKKKKKVKSKSKKRHSSSDSESGSRSPKKISKSKKLASKKKIKDYKKSEKKRRKKSKRYSSSDCSTCSDSDKSSSPVRKSKKRKRVKERGRKKLRISGSKRKRHRSSSSYSTCSGSTRSWDSDPNKNEKQFESSPSKENFERKNQNDGHIESSFRQSPFCEREDNHSEKIEGGDGQSLLDDRYGISYKQSPIKDRFESNFVQSSIEESFENGYQNNLNEKGSGRLRSIIVVKPLDDDVDNISKICDEKPSAGSDEIYCKGNMRIDFEMEHKVKEKEAVDLELILRQKALENLKKFRATRTAKVESHNDKKDETFKGENLDKSLQIAEKTLEPKSSSSVVDQSTESKGGSVAKSSVSVAKSSVSVVDQSTDLKDSSVVNLSGNRIFKNAVHNLPDDSSRNGTFNDDRSNTLNIPQESSNSKENQNERTVTQNASSKVNETEENMVASSIAQNAEVPKAWTQSAGGSQFEQKTFSRMRDGETVEVKYKVYIPKKTPALARRKLQR